MYRLRSPGTNRRGRHNARTLPWKFHEPPRNTREAPVCGPVGSTCGVGRVVTVPVGAPLPDVAVHFVKPPGVGRQGADRHRLLPIQAFFATGVGIVAVVVDLLGVMLSPNEKGVVVPARQAYSHSASLGSRACSPGTRRFSSLRKACTSSQLTFSTGLRVVLELARVGAGHRLPQRLRAGRVGEPEAAAQRHFVLHFVVVALGLVGRRTHQEAPRRDPAEALADAGDGDLGEQPVAIDAERLLAGPATGHRYCRTALRRLPVEAATLPSQSTSANSPRASRPIAIAHAGLAERADGEFEVLAAQFERSMSRVRAGRWSAAATRRRCSAAGRRRWLRSLLPSDAPRQAA
jgi:hypothetical protein